MADYWKSQPRKFCQYCKCWIADNKPSVEFHERGKNHKENVAAKITEIKKKSVDKAKQEEKMSKDFAAMEDAAMKAYQEDLKRMEREAAGLPELATTVTAKPPPQVISFPKKQQKKGKERQKFQKQTRAPVWVEGQSDDGHTYFYNTVTGESRWEKPGDFQSQSSAFAEPALTPSSSAYPWMEALSPDGYTYYYNTETKESSWEKPAGFPSNDIPGSETKNKGESPEEPSTSQPEPLSAAEEGKEEEKSSSGDPAIQGAQVPEQLSQQPNIPKINFRKRKAEPSEKEGEGDKVTEEAPKEEGEEKKEEEAAPSTTAGIEERKDVEVTRKVTPAKRTKAATPYGVWEQIKEEKDPYASVDLQLPQVEVVTTSAPSDLPPEPKPKFKERIITSLGDEGGPASFRKNKTQNGKPRSLRQRDNDD